MNFIREFEKQVAVGSMITNRELVEKFTASQYYDDRVDSYYETAISKAIGWAIRRNENWEMTRRGQYTRIYDANANRSHLIKFLSENLYDILMLKKQIKDQFLQRYHLSSKGLGDDLYFLTESYYRHKGLFKGKYFMSDFISVKAQEIMQADVNRSNQLKYEHMVPKNLYLSQISEVALSGQLSVEFIYNLLAKYYYVCTVTSEEDKVLPRFKMSVEWDEENPFHRYEEAGIEFVRNTMVIITD